MTITMKTPDELELDAYRAEVNALLAECKEHQLALFSKLYPQGVDKMDRDKLRNAVGLCQRTVRKNRELAPLVHE